MPSGITLTVRLIDPSTVPAPGSSRIAALTFQIEARDAGGNTLSSLPAEVNLSAHYTDAEASGLNEAQLGLFWLDPQDRQWKAAPKQVGEPSTNYVAASVTLLGEYSVATP